MIALAPSPSIGLVNITIKHCYNPEMYHLIFSVTYINHREKISTYLIYNI